MKYINKKFWQELICLLSPHKLTVTTWLPWNINNPNPLLSKAHLTTLNINKFKMIETMGLETIASRSP
jgi:hypothetical protein